MQPLSYTLINCSHFLLAHVWFCVLCEGKGPFGGSCRTPLGPQTWLAYVIVMNTHSTTHGGGNTGSA